MLLFKSDSNSQRKFIDLIYQQTNKYANWDPPSEVEVGSYGTMDRTSGAIRVQGNIFADEFKRHLPEGFDPSHYPIKVRPDENEYMTWSRNVHKVTFNPGVEVQSNFASAAFKGTWETRRGRGAMLLIYRPRIKELPPGELLSKLATIPLLKDKVLVTRVYYCPAYALCLSSNSGETISIALQGSAPVAGVSAGGGVTMKWWSDTQAGLLRSGCHDEFCFTPLYDLAKLAENQPKRRAQNSPTPGGYDVLYPWISAGLPWDALDEDGEEIEYSDSNDE